MCVILQTVPPDQYQECFCTPQPPLLMHFNFSAPRTKLSNAFYIWRMRRTFELEVHMSK